MCMKETLKWDDCFKIGVGVGTKPRGPGSKSGREPTNEVG